MNSKRKRILLGVGGVVLLVMLVRAFQPKPVDVDVADVSFGPMRVTVDQDGKARVRERYVVSAPVAGRLDRIMLKPGDAVTSGKTVLAAVMPTDPALLDARVATEAEARVSAADAAREQAGLLLQRARAAYRIASNDLVRARDLLECGGLSRQDFEMAEFTERTGAGEVSTSKYALDIAEFQVQQARAALSWLEPSSSDSPPGRHVIHAPLDGRVLRVFEESSRVVMPGTPLLELGDHADLEIVVDVLSEDAVKILPGAKVVLEHWGGDHPLTGRVRRVEPAAFTKISALGVEEQRVNVIIDLADPAERRAQLGDGYRLDARIVVWESAGVVKIPVGGLFRREDKWAVFTVSGGRARLTPVSVSHMNGREAEVTKGLAKGDRIIVHPADTVRDGVAVRIRK